MVHILGLNAKAAFLIPQIACSNAMVCFYLFMNDGRITLQQIRN